ncbi:peptidylprolyl isomerase [Fulvivirgaceae bacterium BMA10]|uniref:peptidylprolyl isomerase n=1 Tax=Splendidivirga corallicola TaxID=3051826 RepID=A0ABT8KXR3_9BACT|nr:peptidylprolyl isomerase [Fulvivirgaceae bacterium BMA10]
MKHLYIPISILAVSFFTACQQNSYNEETFEQEGVYATISTNKGNIIAYLEYEKVPMTVANFVGLAEGTIENGAVPLGQSYYKNSKFHRVVPGHVIQGGAPDVEEGKTLGYQYPNEIHPDLNHGGPGMLGIANAGPHTNGEQFYITLDDRSYLDGNYTIFGHVVEGLEVVMNIKQGDTIQTVEITRVGEKARNFKPGTELLREMIADAQNKVEREAKEKARKEAALIQKKWPEAITTESGLKYVILDEGQGDKPLEGSKLKVNYSGSLLDGSKAFVSTAEDGKPLDTDSMQVFEYRVEESFIHTGLDEALKNMLAGEKRIVIVPSGLGYATRGFYAKEIKGKKRFVISPNTTLVYEIEVLSID